MAAACRAGAWVSADYRVFHLFPNLTILHVKADAEFWYVLVLQYIPLAPDRTTMRCWFYPAPFAARHSRFNRWTGWFTEFDDLTLAPGLVGYASDAMRFMGATFDPSALYRFNAVRRMLAENGLTTARISARVAALHA